jgi:1,2-diacylglycerol 3-alpha-glucosyltransferase
MPKAYVAMGYNAVDNEFFSQKRNKKEFSAFSFQFSGDIESTGTSTPCFLASNRFVERKNLKGLIRAYAKYVESFQGTAFCFQESSGVVWPLVLLGDGELRVELEALCGELGIKVFSFQGLVFSREKEGQNLKLNSYKLKTPVEGGLVVFAGFRQVEELPFFYGGAGAFIHAALSEPWGLVINEAMASGLPILSSKNVGAAEELVHHGVNGFTFDPENIEELAGLLMKMSQMRQEDREAMGEASRRLIADWGPERFALGAQEAARAAMSAPPKRAGILDRILLEILIRQ